MTVLIEEVKGAAVVVGGAIANGVVGVGSGTVEAGVGCGLVNVGNVVPARLLGLAPHPAPATASAAAAVAATNQYRGRLGSGGVAMIDESRTRGWQKAARLAGVAVLLSGCGATAAKSGPTTTPAVPTHVVAPPATTPVACARNLPATLASTGGATQLITVEPGSGPTVASVALWQRVGRCWAPAGGPWTGWIGRSGFSDHHREGDGTTPTGIYRLGQQVYGNAPDPGIRLPYHRLVCGDWWDEDPSSPAYNTFQHVTCGQAPAFAGDSEALWTETAPYPSFAVVDYNARPIVPFAGSAIFIHADIGVPTNGCVSIPLVDLNRLLRWLDPAAAAAIVMGPSSEIARF